MDICLNMLKHLHVMLDLLKIIIGNETGVNPQCVLQRRAEEIGEGAERLVKSLEVGDQLGVVQREKAGNGFQLNDHRVFNQKVRAVSADSLVKIEHLEFFPPLNRQPL